MKRVKQIVMMAFASLLAQCVWAATMYKNPLAGSETIASGTTAGTITVEGNGICATHYDTKTVISGGTGTIANLFRHPSWGYIVTHTATGWFKVDSLPSSGFSTIYGFQTNASSNRGYLLGVTSEGKLTIGHVADADYTSFAQDENYTVHTTESAVLAADEWHYITVSIEEQDSSVTSARTRCRIKIFVDGTNVLSVENGFQADLGGTAFKEFVIGAGVTAAGLYIDNAVLDGTTADTLALATDESIVVYKADEGVVARIISGAGVGNYESLAAAVAAAGTPASEAEAAVIELCADTDEAAELKQYVTLDTLTHAYTGAVTGYGKLVYHDAIPSAATSTSLKNTAWHGEVWIRGYDYEANGSDNNNKYAKLNELGNTGSKVRISKIVSWGSSGNYCVTVPVILDNDGGDFAIQFGNGWSGNSFDFDHLSGSGTIHGASGGATTMPIVIKEWSGFTGNLKMESKVAVFGERSNIPSPKTEGSIVVPASKEVTLASTATWAANGGIFVNGALKVAGTLSNTAIKGSGLAVYDGKWPDGNSLNQTAWTGTVWIKNISSGSWINLNNYGHSGSKIRFSNNTHWQSGTKGAAATIELVDEGSNPAFTHNGIDSGAVNTFTKLTGTGTYFIKESGRSRSSLIYFGDVSEFSGKIKTETIPVYLGMTSGGTASASNGAAILAANASVTMGGEWICPQGIFVNGDMTISCGNRKLKNNIEVGSSGTITMTDSDYINYDAESDQTIKIAGTLDCGETRQSFGSHNKLVVVAGATISGVGDGEGAIDNFGGSKMTVEAATGDNAPTTVDWSAAVRYRSEPEFAIASGVTVNMSGAVLSESEYAKTVNKTGEGTLVLTGNVSTYITHKLSAGEIKSNSATLKVTSGVDNKVVATKTVDGMTVYGLVDKNPEPIKPTDGTGTFPEGTVIKDASGTVVTTGNTLPTVTGVYTVQAMQNGFPVGDPLSYGVVNAKAAETTTDRVTTAVAVPFKGKTVATLLNTALLNKDDVLMAWVGGKYETWMLDADKNWVAQTTQAKSGNHTAPAAAETVLKCGQAVWVTTAGQIVTFGDMHATGDSVEVTTGHNLLGNTELKAATPAADEDDVIQFVGTDNIDSYTKTGDGWVSKEYTVQERNGKKIVRETVGTKAPTVPVGKGYWRVKPEGTK